MDTSQIAIATACLPDTTLPEAMAQARHLGFTAIGLLGASGGRHSGGQLPGFFWDDLDPAARHDLVAARGAFQRGVIHAPFQDLPLLSVNPYIEREAMRQVMGAVRAADVLELEVVTVHVPAPGRTPPHEYRERMAAALRTLGDAAVEAGTRIGVENLAYPCDAEEHIALLDAVAHPAVGATVDVGHVLHWLKRDGITSAVGQDGVACFNRRLLSLIDRLGRRIVNVHVHDVRPDDLRDHRAVGRGIIDFPSVIAHLEDLGYQGLLELELEEPNCEHAIRESRQQLAQILEE